MLFSDNVPSTISRDDRRNHDSGKNHLRGGLRAVRGLGPAKLEAYGDDLLKMLTGPFGEA